MSLPTNVADMTREQFKQFLDSFDHVFSDCDGVIWTGTPLPESGKFFELMQSCGKSVHFISNNSLRTKAQYEKLFSSAGIPNGYQKLTVPSIAIAEYLKSINFDKVVYCVTCKETRRILQNQGFKCEHGPDEIPTSFDEFRKYLEDEDEIGAVVIDSDFGTNLPKINRCVTYLKKPKVIFINGATDRYVAFTDQNLCLAPGIFTDIVCGESKRKPIQLGKPGKLFGELAMTRAGVENPDRVLFIGDMIEQDVGLGKNMGFKTLLVLTNITKDCMLAHHIQPDFYADSLASIVPCFVKYSSLL